MMINSETLNDAKLIDALHQDDIFAFNELFNKYSQKVYNFTIKHVYNDEDVKDLLQDIFIIIWCKRKDIDSKQSFNGYLFTITLNVIRKYFRKKVKEKKMLENWPTTTNTFSDITNISTEYNSLNEKAQKIINKLPPKRKAVFLLSREQGLPTGEIAEKMNISKKTVENHLNLALRHLRKNLVNDSYLLIFF